jgi:cupredoxin-like protein
VRTLRTFGPGLLALLLLAGVGCLGGEARPPGASPSPTGALERRDFGGRSAEVHGMLTVDTSNATVRMHDRYYEPNVLSGPPRLRVTLMVRNEGTQLHNFSLPAQGIAQDLPPGSIVPLSVEIPASGDAVFFCRFHRDAGMLGALGAS